MAIFSIWQILCSFSHSPTTSFIWSVQLYFGLRLQAECRWIQVTIFQCLKKSGRAVAIPVVSLPMAYSSHNHWCIPEAIPTHERRTLLWNTKRFWQHVPLMGTFFREIVVPLLKPIKHWILFLDYGYLLICTSTSNWNVVLRPWPEVEIACDHLSNSKRFITMTNLKCKWLVGMTDCSILIAHGSLTMKKGDVNIRSRR